MGGMCEKVHIWAVTEAMAIKLGGTLAPVRGYVCYLRHMSPKAQYVGYL